MSSQISDKKALKNSVKRVVGVLQSIKKNREILLRTFDGDALHDIRVAARKFEAIDALSAKTLGVCLDEDRRSKLKSLLKTSSALRDMEEFFRFASQESPEQKAQREGAQAIFIENIKNICLEKELFDRYKIVYVILRSVHPNLLALRESALEGTLEALAQTSKRYKKTVGEEDVDFEELHSIRKKCKRARYQFDFLFGSENEGSILCKRTQDRLGKINDYRVWLSFANENEALKEEIGIKLCKELGAAKEEPFANKEHCAKIARELRERMALIL